jgi:hypothetical protein
MFLFSEREGNVLLVGGRNVFLAGEKRVKFLVEREECSFFSERSRNILRAREGGEGERFL